MSPSELSQPSDSGATEGKNPKTFLSHNLFAGIFYNKTRIFYINVNGVFINLAGIPILNIVVPCRILNPCRDGKHGARFD
jgi:hypothetical protein